MPRIEEYNAPDLGLRPSETGVEATAAAARRINSAYNEKAELQKETGNRYAQDIKVAGEVANDAIAHQEISRGATSFSAIMAGKTREWEAISQKADPNDPTVAASFMSGLSSQLEQYRGGFLSDKGQAWADQHINQFQTHMMNKTTADMSRAADHAIAINAAQTTNNLSNTAYADPSEINMRHLLGMSDSITGGVVGTSPTLQGKAGVKSTLVQKNAEQIVKAGVLGYIEKNGEMPPWLANPELNKYVNVAELVQFQKAQRAEQRLAQTEARADRADRDYNDRRQFNEKANKLEEDMMPKDDGTPAMAPADIRQRVHELNNHPGASLEPGRVSSVIKQAQAVTTRLNKPEALAEVSHQTTMELMKDIRSGKVTSTDPVSEAFEAGNLNNTDFGFLNKVLADKTPQGAALEADRKSFLSRYERTVDPAMTQEGIRSELGDQQMYALEMDIRRQEDILRKGGKDPHLVYDPRSEQFFGRPENLDKYKVSLQQIQQYRDAVRKGQPAAGILPAAPPKPPAGMPDDAFQGRDNKWYVERNGKIYPIVLKGAGAPKVPMSE